MWKQMSGTARSVEDETRNAALNGNRNPEWWGDFSQIVEIEKIKFLGISRYKVKLRFWLDLKCGLFCGTNSKWDFCLIWICSWLIYSHHSGFRLPFNSAFRVSSSTERAVLCNNLYISYLVKWLRFQSRCGQSWLTVTSTWLYSWTRT